MTKSRSAIFLQKFVKVSHLHQHFLSSSDSVPQERRTHYGLSKVSTVSDDELKSIVEEAVMHVPSPFNMQSGRAVILTGEASDKLWLNIVLPGYLKLVGGDGEP
jgi:predicted oxidoreductase (fatty acid repression mutant protein)